ncbi:hypothetical protein NERG_02326 [Nematocida ausubeli]|uniref:Uncharacterized protein n=1 Tax=Nematocida ausubeli (strain ATCC PRA-371 / ERTm2) TaxID=1913371 RepID=H8ZFF5_NEMA1|nr:hypothetical protein NERG_02326 [Nematocida ausubeli]
MNKKRIIVLSIIVSSLLCALVVGIIFTIKKRQSLKASTERPSSILAKAIKETKNLQEPEKLKKGTEQEKLSEAACKKMFSLNLDPENSLYEFTYPSCQSLQYINKNLSSKSNSPSETEIKTPKVAEGIKSRIDLLNKAAKNSSVSEEKNTESDLIKRRNKDIVIGRKETMLYLVRINQLYKNLDLVDRPAQSETELEKALTYFSTKKNYADINISKKSKPFLRFIANTMLFLTRIQAPLGNCIVSEIDMTNKVVSVVIDVESIKKMVKDKKSLMDIERTVRSTLEKNLKSKDKAGEKNAIVDAYKKSQDEIVNELIRIFDEMLLLIDTEHTVTTPIEKAPNSEKALKSEKSPATASQEIANFSTNGPLVLKPVKNSSKKNVVDLCDETKTELKNTPVATIERWFVEYDLAKDDKKEKRKVIMKMLFQKMPLDSSTLAIEGATKKNEAVSAQALEKKVSEEEEKNCIYFIDIDKIGDLSICILKAIEENFIKIRDNEKGSLDRKVYTFFRSVRYAMTRSTFTSINQQNVLSINRSKAEIQYFVGYLFILNQNNPSIFTETLTNFIVVNKFIEKKQYRKEEDSSSGDKGKLSWYLTGKSSSTSNTVSVASYDTLASHNIKEAYEKHMEETA